MGAFLYLYAMSYPLANYGLRYTSIIRGKDNYLYTFNVSEAGYENGIVNEIPTAASPFIHEYLTNVDDPFQPIISSTLTINYDLTDIGFAPPDIGTDDDFQYYGELVDMNGGVIFRGWMLTEGVQAPFTSGRQFVSIKFIDGLQLLQNFTYEPPAGSPNQSVNLNGLTTLLEIVTICLGNIDYPQGYELGVICRLFAAGMTTIDETILPQAAITNRTFQDEINCFNVLEKILDALGLQLFQAEGKWWIVSPNERAKDVANYVLYDNTGSFVLAGQKALRYNLKRYLPNTEDLYFVNNSQVKIIRKGYSRFDLKFPSKYSNLISNSDFSSIISGLPEFYSITSNAGQTVAYETLQGYKSIRIVANPSTTLLVFQQGAFTPLSNNKAVANSSLRFSFLWKSHNSTSGTAGIVVISAIEQVTPTTFRSWYWSANGYWIASGIVSSPFEPLTVPRNTESIFLQFNNSDINNFSIQTTPLPTPNPASIRVGVRQNFGSGLDTPDTSFANWQLVLSSSVEKTTYSLDLGGKWKYEKTFDFGTTEIDDNNTPSPCPDGAILGTNGNLLTSYENPDLTPSTYGELGNYLANAYSSILNQRWTTFQGDLQPIQVLREGLPSNPCLPTNISVSVLQNIPLGTEVYTFTFDEPVNPDVNSLTIEYRLTTDVVWQSSTGAKTSPRTLSVPIGSYVFRIRSNGGSCQNQRTPSFTTSLVDVPSVVGPFSYLCVLQVDDDTNKPYDVDGGRYVPTQLTIDYKDSRISGTFVPTAELTTPPEIAEKILKLKREPN